jgi:hypothetical protein
MALPSASPDSTPRVADPRRWMALLVLVDISLGGTAETA